jgi:hypothetical protein
MARLLLRRFSRTSGDEQPPPDPPAGPRPRRRTAPPAADLRRERRNLLQVREERIRDLGGVVLEMYRRDDFRDDLLAELSAEIAAIEERLHDIEHMLDARRPPVARCACGAPLHARSQFCATCGRPVGEAAIDACPTCGHALAADARFCPACGTPAPDAERLR